MIHQPFCRRSRDPLGRWWHTARGEMREANYAYALAHSGGDQRYARAIVDWLFGAV